MFRKFGVFIEKTGVSCVTANEGDRVHPDLVAVRVRGKMTWQRELEMLINLRLVSHIVPPNAGEFYPWIVMQNGSSWLSSIEYKFLAEALDGLKL